MTAAPATVAHVIGRARAGDPVTAAARGLRARLARLGHPGPLVDVAAGDLSIDGAPGLVVHTVDGGEALATVADHLARRALTVVHHGSRPGSERSGLRRLRGATTRALAADPAAREELRALGFPGVEPLPAGAGDDALTGIEPDPAVTEHLAGHPGPRVLALGPIEPGREVERLVAAFALLVTGAAPSAVLSLCGPIERWYQTWLHRHVTTRGLVACEVVAPADEAEVAARLDRADVVVSLRPSGSDPYVRHAARRGVPVVAPPTAGTAALGAALVSVPPAAPTDELAAALARAIGAVRAAPTERAPSAVAGDDRALLRALGLR